MLVDLIGMIIANTLIILSVYVLNNKKLNLLDLRMYLVIVLYNVLVIFNVDMNEQIIKTLLNFCCFIFAVLILNELNLKKTLISTTIIYLFLFLIEIVIFGIFICSFKITNSDAFVVECMDSINNNPSLTFILNVVSSILLYVFCSGNKIKEIHQKLLNTMETLNLKKFSLLLKFVLLSLAFLYVLLFYNKNIIAVIIVFIVLILLIVLIILKDINIRTEYEESKEKYNDVQYSLVEYEEMIDKYRVDKHENKNQLLTIQNMIKHNDSKVNDYIDNLVGNVYMTNEKIMMDVSIIPAGGLRATIHTKLNIMDDKNIKYALNIDRKLRSIDFDNIKSNSIIKICKIVSVFIDNAIDEVDTHKNDKLVNIEMYLDENKIIIEISNKYKNKFDTNKIYDKKYTTKSNGHGYGLSLVKELIDSEDILSTYPRIDDDIFTQVLEIKLKK